MRPLAFPRSAFHVAIFGLAISSALATQSAHAADAADQWDGNWHGSITPYGWLPGVTGETKYRLPNSEGGTDVTAKTNNDVWSSLSGFFMLQGDVRKGDWGMFADLDWVKFDNEAAHFEAIGNNRFGANAHLDTNWGIKGGMINLAGLYTMAHGQQGNIDLVFGVRYLWLKGNLNWNFNLAGNQGNLNIANSGHLSNQTHVTDGIIGIRGSWMPFSDSHFFFPYYVDFGTGDSDSTYQINAGVAYAFSWGDIALLYRDVHYEEGTGNTFLKSAELSGPAFSFTWHF
jgi:hypothetical protein